MVYTCGRCESCSECRKISTHIENLLRAENGINLRAYYGVNNSTGTPTGEGSVLIPGTSQNANTITANGLNLIKPVY